MLKFKNNVLPLVLALHKNKVHFISSQHPDSNIRFLKKQRRVKMNLYKEKLIMPTLHKVIQFIRQLTKKYTKLLMAILKIQILSNYLFHHKAKMKLLYKNFNQKLQAKIEKVINKVNDNNEHLP